MNQDHVLLLLLRAVLIADMTALAAFVGEYTLRARWWENPVGRTIVIKDLMLAAAFTPSVLSLFFKFSAFTSRVAGWTDVGLFAGIAAAVTWRIVVFERIHREPPAGDPP